MTDRLAFRTFMALASILLLCLGAILVVPFKLIWPGVSWWLVCCTMLMPHLAMPMPVGNTASMVAMVSAALLLSVMVGNSVTTAWRLGVATYRLLHSTQAARLPQPPVVARLADRLKLTHAVVVVAGREPFSFCYGLWRPHICLSQGLIELLTEAELEAVLHHEAYHLQRQEPLRMALAICLSRLFFFAPLLAELRDCYLAEKEMAADAAASAVTGRAALAGALHKLVTMNKPVVLPGWAAVAGLSVTAQRVDRLIQPLAKPSWAPSRWSIITTLALLAAGCLWTVAGLG
ncbi:MAG: hypothetical protein DPW09_44940 [Anaerolineae bacterium]|nr:hypothetical protein [Anaerolineae bacterium]